MVDDVDYESLVDGTIADVKDEIKDRDDLDFERVLEAEKQNKDRKTLKSWLESHMDTEQDEEDDSSEQEGSSEESSEESEVEGEEVSPYTPYTDEDSVADEKQSVWELPVTNFVFGLVIGLAVAALFAYAQGGGAAAGDAAITADQASERAPTIMRQQMENLVPANMSLDISAGDVDSSKYGDVYVVPMTMQAGPQEQEVQAYVTRQSGMLFLSPIDLESGDPIGQQQQAPAQ